MSRAIGIAVASFSGVRVAGQLTYVPAHVKNGKKINARAIIPVYKNSHRGTNAKTGEKGRTDSFKLVAWGKLADTCARSCSKGKALDVICEPQSYLGGLFNMDGSRRVDQAGQPIETTKTSFTVMSIIFGEDSAKCIADEIAEGRRPQFWNVPGHPDYQLWTQILQTKQTPIWNGQDQTFEYARVALPQGQGIQLDFSAYQAQPTAAPNMAPQGLPGMVANTFNPQMNPAPPAANATQFVQQPVPNMVQQPQMNVASPMVNAGPAQRTF